MFPPRRPSVPTVNRSLRRDLYAAGAAALLVTAAVLIGRHIQGTSRTLFVDWPPLLASWGPHVGPGTPAALVVAIATVAYGPSLAARLPWRTLLPLAWGTATAWICSLALIDGWDRGIAHRLTTRYEYLQVIDRFDDIPAALRDFTHHILLDSPDNWPAHIAGHPPAATLTFVLLDRIGLRGGGWAGMWCVIVGATACVAVLVTIRALADEALARRAAPFLVLAPAAVWMGTSADAYFAAVAAWAVALLALAVTGRSLWWAGASGLLFGLTCYLSYGLTLVALIAAAVLALGRHGIRERPALLVPLLAGLAVVPTAFTLAGFDWWEAYHLLVTRYYQGAAWHPPLRLLGVGQPGLHGAHHGPGDGGGPAPDGCGAAPPPHRHHRPGRRGPARAPRVRRAPGPAGRRPVRDEQGGDGTHLAALRGVAPPRLRAPSPPPRLAHRPGAARAAPQPSAVHRVVTAYALVRDDAPLGQRAAGFVRGVRGVRAVSSSSSSTDHWS